MSISLRRRARRWAEGGENGLGWVSLGRFFSAGGSPGESLRTLSAEKKVFLVMLVLLDRIPSADGLFRPVSQNLNAAVHRHDLPTSYMYVDIIFKKNTHLTSKCT